MASVWDRYRRRSPYYRFNGPSSPYRSGGRQAAASTKTSSPAAGAQTPALPPLGYFDPAITSQADATHRGYGYLQDDTATGDTRNLTDYLLAKAGIDRGSTRGLEDIATQQSNEDVSYGRGKQDLLTSLARGEGDHNTAIANLVRSYQRRGAQQQQGAAARGVLGGSALAQAAAKRQLRQGEDQAPIDQSFMRFRDDNQQAQNRSFESHQANLALLDRSRGRLAEDVQSQLGQLDLENAPASADNPLGGRSWQDRHTALTRGGIEDQYAGIGAGQQAWYQAGLNGYVFPTTAATPAAKTSTASAARPGRTFSRPGGLGIPLGRRRRRTWGF